MQQQRKRRFRVRAGTVALHEAEAEKGAQAIQAVAVQPWHQPPRQPQRTYAIALPGHSRARKSIAEEVAVEAGVVGNHDRTLEQPSQVRQETLEPGPASDERGVDTGDAGHDRRDRDAGLDQVLKAVQDHTVAHANRGDLEHAVVLRAAAGRLQVDDDERGLRQCSPRHSGQSKVQPTTGP